MVKFILMCGISGSGKSTAAERYKNAWEAEIVSSDAIRKELYGDENDQEHNEQVFKEVGLRVRELLEQGENVVQDATNLTYKDRLKALNNVSKLRDVYKVCVVMDTPIEECIDRDQKRMRSVGADVIRHQVSKFNMPQYFEGWDSIRIGFERKELKFNEDKALDTFSLMRGFNQQNPHHKYDLATHCFLVYKNAESMKLDDIVCKAALFHDIGKLFTQKIDENGVAHYYNHENWSAYYILSHPDIVEVESSDSLLFLLFIVNNHMHIREIERSEKARKKHITRWGETWYTNLVKFSECDNKGSGMTKEEHDKLKNGDIDENK